MTTLSVSLHLKTIQLMAATNHSASELPNKRILGTAMKARFSPTRQRALTVFKASVCVIVKMVCECVCLLIGACGRHCHCLCVNVCLACRTIVGKQSEDPRSCWKEMIGFRTRWPLGDRWLGAGLAEPKSPTHTYVGSHKPHTYTQAFRKAGEVSAVTYSMHVKPLWVCGLYLYTYIYLVVAQTPGIRNQE